MHLFMCFVLLRIAEVDCCSGQAFTYDILVGFFLISSVFCFVLFVKKGSMIGVDNCNGNEQNSIINIIAVVVVTGTGPPQSFGFVWVFFFNHFLVVLFFRFDGGRSSGTSCGYHPSYAPGMGSYNIQSIVFVVVVVVVTTAFSSMWKINTCWSEGYHCLGVWIILVILVVVTLLRKSVLIGVVWRCGRYPQAYYEGGGVIRNPIGTGPCHCRRRVILFRLPLGVEWMWCPAEEMPSRPTIHISQ